MSVYIPLHIAILSLILVQPGTHVRGASKTTLELKKNFKVTPKLKEAPKDIFSRREPSI